MKRTPQANHSPRAWPSARRGPRRGFTFCSDTLRDWEHGRKDPDTAPRVYLRVIGARSSFFIASRPAHGIVSTARARKN